MRIGSGWRFWLMTMALAVTPALGRAQDNVGPPDPDIPLPIGRRMFDSGIPCADIRPGARVPLPASHKPSDFGGVYFRSPFVYYFGLSPLKRLHVSRSGFLTLVLWNEREQREEYINGNLKALVDEILQVAQWVKFAMLDT